MGWSPLWSGHIELSGTVGFVHFKDEPELASHVWLSLLNGPTALETL